MRARWTPALLCVALALGCTPRGRAPRLPDDVDLNAIRRSVVAVRGLPERADTPIRLVDEKTFVRMLVERNGGSAPERDRRHAASGPAVRSVAAQEQALELEDTLGFYDIPGRAIFLREPSEGDRDGVPLSWVLVHELTHALQHQNLPVQDLSKFTILDERLAYLALLEGDAMVTMLAHSAEENFVPVARALQMASRNIQRGEADRLEQFGAPPEKLENVSPHVRARMVFPYTAGAVFVGAIHRTGGFALVNEMYRRPPRTTEQVLHPEKYLMGEGPVELPPPEPPGGYVVRQRGRMGELGILGLLESCVSRNAARAAAAGWGGDAFTVATHPDGRVAVLWGTAWDTAEDAGEFAQAIRQCSDTRGSEQVLHEGHRVSVLSGAPVPDPRAAHRHVLGLYAWRAPASPPLSATALTPLPPLPQIPPATLSGDRYDSPRLDLALPVPPGFKASLSDGALLLESPDGLMEVDFRPAMVTTESTAKVYRDFLRSLGLPESRLQILSNDRMQTPVGEGLERTWNVPGSSVRLQVLVLPVCGGNGAILFRSLWSDDHTGRLIAWVIHSARGIRGGVPPVCAEL